MNGADERARAESEAAGAFLSEYEEARAEAEASYRKLRQNLEDQAACAPSRHLRRQARAQIRRLDSQYAKMQKIAATKFGELISLATEVAEYGTTRRVHDEASEGLKAIFHHD